MATRQQLRGDGSKEYQIITNLSRGINNSVADDVLVDNAFRDVVNFSSDQLGNIAKRDNLLNSNFKEFIRKLAYGDFNLDTFKIADYVGERLSIYDYKYKYKRYSYGRVDQIILQNFYEMLFTDKHYTGNPLYATYSGVAKDSDGIYHKVPAYNGAPCLEDESNKSFIGDYDIDAPIVDDTDKQNYNTSNVETIVTHYRNPFKAEIKCVNNLGTELEILDNTLPDGWVLNEEHTLLSKTFDTYYFENIVFSVRNNGEEELIKMSVCDGNTLPLITNFYAVIMDKEETDDYYDIYINILPNVGGQLGSIYGVEKDYGWSIVEHATGIGDITANYAYKRFYKSEIDSFISIDLRIIAASGNSSVEPAFSCNVLLTYSKSISNLANPTNYRFNTYNFDIYNTTLKHIHIINQDNFLKSLQNLDQIFKENDFVNSNELSEDINFDAYFILYGDSRITGANSSNGILPSSSSWYIQFSSSTAITYTNCLLIYRLKITLDKNYNLEVSIIEKTIGDDFITNATFQNESWRNVPRSDAYIAHYTDDALDNLFISKYSNYLYLATGHHSLIRLSIEEEDLTKCITSIASNNDFSIESVNVGTVTDPEYKNQVVPKQAYIYAPVPYEITNPGFNLLSSSPLNFIENTGNVDKIRGVFYTVNGEVVQNIPCNIPFEIHLIVTGISNISTPKIRPNNGELDEGKNPYKDLTGTWSTDLLGEQTNIFNCTGIDNIEAYEMKITKGDDDYLTYFTPTPYVPDKVGDVSSLSSLVLGCQRLKVINNQLVLFGNGGYIFFSDFENFKYFPSYYYVYVANGTDEEIIDIVYFRQFYAIFTNKRILRMSGDFATDNFEIGPLNDFMGCINHSTIRQVYNSLYFIGYNGIYSLNQGYLGAGTENLKRIDTQLVNTFNFDNVAYCYVLGNIYIIIMKDGKTWYTYDVDNDMFLRYDYSLGDSVTLSNISFIETLEENQIYAILTTTKNNNVFADDLLLYNFPLARGANYDYKDSDEGYISSFETPYINLGTPTNTKKFKNLFIKMFNETDSLIPLYITVYVDDILAITPEDYVIELDEETNTYFYYFKVDNNAELLRAHNLLGTLTLGEDTLGDNVIQQLKLKINAKGRAIKIILADGYDYPNKDNSAIIKYRNSKKFSISTIGIVYKLKKVKEG